MQSANTVAIAAGVFGRNLQRGCAWLFGDVESPACDFEKSAGYRQESALIRKAHSGDTAVDVDVKFHDPAETEKGARAGP